jgi:hypothetical protein
MWESSLQQKEKAAELKDRRGRRSEVAENSGFGWEQRFKRCVKGFDFKGGFSH